METMETMETGYPIAEEFDSIQGEGHWTGTAMRFIRFAGCNVGRMLRESSIGVQSVNGEPYHAMCTLWDGRTFGCDTNYQKHSAKSPFQLLSAAWQSHICLTGGEPLLHDLSMLIRKATRQGKMIHLETSGTRYPEWLREDPLRHQIWISVSPKEDCLPEMISLADEIKILVDERFDERQLLVSFLNNNNVYLQPVNYEMTVNRENLERCLQLQKRFPEFRISCQLHKFMNVR